MEKDRIEYLKDVLSWDFSERHDSPHLFFSVDDLKQLIEKAEKAERYEEALRFYADSDNYQLSEEAEEANLANFINALDMDEGDIAREALKK